MTPNERDGWLGLMVEQQGKVITDATQEIVRLRAAVRALESRLAAAPGELWEMQERIVMLEAQLAAYRTPATEKGER